MVCIQIEWHRFRNLSSLEFVSLREIDVKKMLLQKRRRKRYDHKRENLIPKRKIVQDYGVTSNTRNRTVSFFVPSVSFLLKSPNVIFQYSNFTLSSNVTFLTFQILMFLSL